MRVFQLPAVVREAVAEAAARPPLGRRGVAPSKFQVAIGRANGMGAKKSHRRQKIPIFGGRFHGDHSTSLGLPFSPKNLRFKNPPTLREPATALAVNPP